MEAFAAGIFLAIINQKFIDYIAEPIRRKYPHYDLWYLQYVSLATGAALAWFAGVDLFGAWIADPLTSRIVTAAAVGGGSSFLYDIFDKRPV